MKKLFIPVMALSVLFSSCFSQGGTTGLGAAGTGAAIGGVLGSIVGQNSNSTYGSTLGGILGTVAGVAVGNAISKKSTNNSNAYGVLGNILGAGLVDSNGTAVTGASMISLTNFRFVDTNNNNAIDAGESCKIVFDIVNGSTSAITNITPVLEVTNDIKGLMIASNSKIDNLPAKSKVSYSIPITATMKLKTGSAAFRAYVQDTNGNYSNTQEFTISTKKK